MTLPLQQIESLARLTVVVQRVMVVSLDQRFVPEPHVIERSP